MADSKDERQSSVHLLLRRRPGLGDRVLAARSLDADDATPDPLFDALRRLGADMLDEPVPERLLDALFKARAGKADR